MKNKKKKGIRLTPDQRPAPIPAGKRMKMKTDYTRKNKHKKDYKRESDDW